jgi:hypothetical protein
MSDSHGFTIHGKLTADSANEAEDSGAPLLDALLALDFVTEAEVWISLEPEGSVSSHEA